MISRYLIEKKLRRIEELLNELKLAHIESFQEFQSTIIVKRFIERNIELAIEQMVDICKHFVSGLNLKEPETYAECFSIIASQGVIPSMHISTFQSMVRFRNILIHVYDTIDDSLTYSIFKNHLNDFKIFITVIRQYIKADEGQNPGFNRM
jgi:uncharacterized protein YutE (UPF0331/DUF86 family)